MGVIRNMRLSANFLPNPGRADFESFIASIQAAEQAGFEAGWVLDSQLLWGDIYVYMSHALAATERIVMSAGVTNPVTRHLTVTASAHVTLNQVYPGRVILALGRGNTSCTFIGLKPLRLAPYAAAVRDIRALMAGDTVTMNGNEVRIAFADDSIPIVVPASGPKMLRLAGELADIVQLDVGANPEAVAWAIGQVREGAVAAGRDPQAVQVGLVAPLYVTDDQEAAWTFARSFVEDLLLVRLREIARQAPDLELPGVLARLVGADATTVTLASVATTGSEELATDRWRQEYQRQAEVMRLPDAVVDEHVIAGPREKCLDRLRTLSDLGVQDLCVFMLNNEFEQMERIGEEIIPVAREMVPAGI